MEVIFHFLKIIFKSTLGNDWSRIILKKTILGFSYRVPEKLKISYRLIPKFFLKSIALIWVKRKFNDKIFESSIIYDTDKITIANTTDYFKETFFRPPQTIVFRNTLPNLLNFWEKLLLSLWSLTNSFFSLCILLLFRSNSNSVFTLELIENALLFKLIKQKNISRIFILSSFEKDILFLCNFLTEKGAEIHLFPSSNPIELFYKYVQADKFWFSSPFQILEAKKLKKNWIVKEFGFVPPYDFQYIKKFNKGILFPYKIGIISSGMGFRKELGFLLGDEKEYLAETLLYETISSMVLNKAILKEELVIFLHPKEKNKSHFNQLKNFYSKKLGFLPNFGPIDKPARECFHLAEVSIATISTAQIERLFGGYKSIFAPLSALDNPFSDDRIQRISAESKPKLENLLEQVLSLSEAEFFENYNLEDYHYSKFNRLPFSLNENIEV